MTKTAAWPKALAVLVVAVVTIRARQGGVFIGGGDVTLFTWGHGMQADKGEGRQIVVKKYFCAPRLLVVAIAAVFTFLPFVDVVELVAGVTGGLELVVENMSGMTGFACQLCVQAAQWELRVFAVIETQLHPAFRAVALATFLSVAASVFIIRFVARKAGSALCVTMKIATMTSVAANNSVFTCQWEVRFGVVVKSTVRPLGRRVAHFTTLTIASRMNVVQAVTGNTCGGGIFVALVDMTLLAAGLAMLTSQRK